MNSSLETTEPIRTDWRGLYNFHHKASKDRCRSKNARAAHQVQAAHVKRLHLPPCQDSDALFKVALIKSLSVFYQAKLKKKAKALYPFCWAKFCEAARRSQKSPRQHV
jgi:hypothetical protein